MGELAFILVGALLVNNFVLAQFLGLCPFLGATRNLDGALALGLATCFVLSLSAVLCQIVHQWLLEPLGLEWLKLVAFIVLIAGSVQGVELYLRAASPVLHRSLGIYLPLITTNCAVLGVALLSLGQGLSLAGTIVFSLGAAAGFALVMALFGALRERLEGADVPGPLRGAPIALMAAGLMSLGFMGFAGLDA